MATAAVSLPRNEQLPAPAAEFERQLEPRSMNQAKALAADLFASRLFSAYGNAPAVLSTILIGRELGLVKVKGKELLVPIVDVAGRDNDSVDPSFYRHFADALAMIRAGNIFSARAELERLGEARPNDTPVRLYLDRLAADPEHPPAEMVFEFDTK